jgi:hypothetical protein
VVVDAEDHPACAGLRHLVGKSSNVESIREPVPLAGRHLRGFRELGLRRDRAAQQDPVLIVYEDPVPGFEHPARVATAGDCPGLEKSNCQQGKDAGAQGHHGKPFVTRL